MCILLTTFVSVYQLFFFSSHFPVHSLLVSIVTVSALSLHGLAVTACHTQWGVLQSKPQWSVWSVQATLALMMTNSSSAEGLTLQLLWRPSASNTLMLQKKYISQLVYFTIWFDDLLQTFSTVHSCALYT